MMKALFIIIIGIFILALSGWWLMGESGEYFVSGLKGNAPTLESLSLSILVGGIGVFIGIILVVIGFWKRQQSRTT